MTDPGSIEGSDKTDAIDNAGPDVRVSTLLGSRVCTKCGFDLCGQPVMREAKYGMLMVRCPECGMVAALLEYPQKTRWLGKWTGFLSALWLLVLLLAAFISGAILNGAAITTAQATVRDYATAIATAFDTHMKSLPQTTAGSPYYTGWQPSSTPSADSWVDSVWWEGVAEKTLKQQGGLWRAIQWPPLVAVIYELPQTVLIGVLWSVALLHLKRRRLLLAAPALIALGFVLGMLDFGRMGTFFGSNRPAYELAVKQAGLPAQVVAMLVLMGGLWLGMWIGRPLARLAVRTFLPPRLWGSLSLLWIEEGLTPPSGLKPVSELKGK